MSEPRRKRLLICGPVAFPGQPAAGGFQSANLRVGALAQSLGFEVDYLRYPDVKGGAATKLAAYARAFGRILHALTFGLRADIVHFTPLIRHFTAFEVVITSIARARGMRVVVDLRAGNQARVWQAGGGLYRALYRRLLKNGHVIAVESPQYEALTREAAGRDALWLPNHVPDALVAAPRAAPAAHRPPRLIYVGAQSEAKGVRHACAVLEALQDPWPGTRLALAGHADAGFIDSLSPRAKPFIDVLGAVPFETLKGELDRADVFMFLTHWEGEGHSNALTEAMARGCLAIVTRRGFNVEVVQEGGLVIDDRDCTDLIARRIADLWRDDGGLALSHAATAVVLRTFTATAATARLKAIYEAARG